MKSLVLRIVKRVAGIFGFQYVGINRIPEYSLLGLRNRDFKTIIDIGANEGQFAKEIVKLFPNAKLVSLEPIAPVFQKLKLWSETLGNNQVLALNYALGECDETMHIYYHTNHSPSSSLLELSSATIEEIPETRLQEKIAVEVRRLDNLREIRALLSSGPVLIKIDVQGFEDRVLKGGPNTFKQADVVILEISIKNYYSGQAKFPELVSLLTEYGYIYQGNLNQVYSSQGTVDYIDAVFSRGLQSA